MAKVRNITRDVLSLFRADAPPVHGADCPDPMCGKGCNEVELRDENFVDRAWPTSTWELVEAPTLEGYADLSTEEALLWAVPEPEPDPEFDPSAHNIDVVTAHLAAADADERARVIAAETAGKARKTITEWSE